MVLDNGTLAEMDSPANLLAVKQGGVFKGLWEKHLKSHGDSGGNGSGKGKQ